MRRLKFWGTFGFALVAACPRAYAWQDLLLPAAGRLEGGSARADAPAVEILKRAMAGDRSVREESLVEIEALLARNDKDADAHYARGWILSRLDRGGDAVKAYDRAFDLDPTLAAAAYNAGVVLSNALHRDKDGVAQFDRAFKADPTLVDAAYNAGQGYYNLKEFQTAAERWKAASALAPDDFQTAKKLVQAYHALGAEADAARWRDRVFALRMTSRDPNVAKLKDYVFDQFEVGKHKVFAAETFDTSGDLAYVYRFDVFDGNQRLGSVNLETSAIIREAGMPYLLGMDKPGVHSQLGQAWKTLPAYKDLKPLVVKAIGDRF
jgi:tetratricopeptide (TPR) repeat protein